MSITPDGYLDWATRIPGIADKVYSEPNSGLGGIACHSVVGQETEFQDGVPNRFLSTEKGSDGRYTAYAAASCMFILRKNGTVIQMYPIWASTWTSGGREANTSCWAIEAEGGMFPNYGELLTEAATLSFIGICREWEGKFGKKLQPGITLRQHKDIALQYEYAPTACASDRYAAAWERLLKREVDMTPAEVEAITRRVVQEEIARDNEGDVLATTFLSFLSQAVGAEPSTFTLPDGTPDPRLAQIRDYISALARGGLDETTVLAKVHKAIASAEKILKDATVGK